MQRNFFTYFPCAQCEPVLICEGHSAPSSSVLWQMPIDQRFPIRIYHSKKIISSGFSVVDNHCKGVLDSVGIYGSELIC